jgi:hypothetical protein
MATYNGVSLLDHVYVSEKNKYPFFAHFPFAGSDHDLCIVSRKINVVKTKPRYISVRNLRTADWNSFQDNLSKFEFKHELNQESSNTEFGGSIILSIMNWRKLLHSSQKELKDLLILGSLPKLNIFVIL